MQPRRRHQDLTLEDDARATDWYAFLVAIDEALIYQGWAAPFLLDMQATVQRTHRVAPDQRRALANIEAGRRP